MRLLKILVVFVALSLFEITPATAQPVTYSNSEPVLSMSEPKQKLAKLEDYMPNASNDLVYEFGRFIVGYLNPELVPMGFVLGCEVALYDLQRGVSSRTGKPIQSKLVGQHPIVYVFLRMEIQHIAEAIFPAEFAAGVKIFIEEVNAEK